MKAFIKWAVAVLAVITAFTIPAWLCGALILPGVLKDPGIRWGIAAALGAAVAGLAALWGYSFATGDTGEEHAETAPGTGSGKIVNTIKGGKFRQTVIQARDISIGSAPPQPGQRDQ